MASIHSRASASALAQATHASRAVASHIFMNPKNIVIKPDRPYSEIIAILILLVFGVISLKYLLTNQNPYLVVVFLGIVCWAGITYLILLVNTRFKKIESDGNHLTIKPFLNPVKKRFIKSDIKGYKFKINNNRWTIQIITVNGQRIKIVSDGYSNSRKQIEKKIKSIGLPYLGRIQIKG
jgi:hypothetical protein